MADKWTLFLYERRIPLRMLSEIKDLKLQVIPMKSVEKVKIYEFFKVQYDEIIKVKDRIIYG